MATPAQKPKPIDSTDSKEELLEKEERIVFNTDSVRVRVCGEERELTALPVKVAKQLSTVLNTVIKGFNAMQQTPEEDREMTPLGGQEEKMADAFTDCLALMAQHYRWSCNRDDIENTMPLKDIRKAVDAQVNLNEDNDFLLVPSRIISRVLSQAMEALNQNFAPSPPSSPAAPSLGDATPSVSPSATPSVN